MVPDRYHVRVLLNHTEKDLMESQGRGWMRNDWVCQELAVVSESPQFELENVFLPILLVLMGLTS
jgi:hypothetical protein